VYVQSRAHAEAARLGTGILLFVLHGCGGSFTGSDGPPTTLSLSAFDDAAAYVESDANDLLAMAEPVEPTAEAQVIRGDISSPSDVDVYDLGPVSAGDRVLVDVATDSLDGAIALFDSDGAALLVNDHRNVYLGRNGPFVDVVIRRPSLSCMVAMAATPGYNSSGDYVLSARHESHVEIPQPHPDVILLDFTARKNVRIGTRPTIDVPTFDASAISSRYEGSTDEMIADIVRMVREDFAAYDVVVLSTSEGDEADSSTTRIHFGTFDQALLGVAEGVDEFNAHQGQSAIVFTDTFAAFRALSPSVTEMAQALANVASHEIGHLLGLVHTNNPDDLMDVTASLNELLLDQEFAKSPIYAAVFPLGSQDSVQSLLDAVGGDEQFARTKSAGRDKTRAEVQERPTLFRARGFCLLSGCGLEGH
jgi:predicted Zn-dependent protease